MNLGNFQARVDRRVDDPKIVVALQPVDKGSQILEALVGHAGSLAQPVSRVLGPRSPHCGITVAPGTRFRSRPVVRALSFTILTRLAPMTTGFRVLRLVGGIDIHAAPRYNTDDGGETTDRCTREPKMIRLIKRYGSRKLYDTEESRYVALDELAGWIRDGQQIKVIDNKSADDVTSQTLTQIISEEGRRGTSLLPNELLHDLIRAGEQAVSNGVEQLQNRMDRLVQASMDRIGPVRRAREEMAQLRERLEELEISLAAFEGERREASDPSGNE
jgi:polyhydroxyalkanoate synthesis repressor PhaR